MLVIHPPPLLVEVEDDLKDATTADTGVLLYTTGCQELDLRVFSPAGRGRRAGGEAGQPGLKGGNVVAVSAEGDAGLVLSLQLVVRHLLSPDAVATAATARVVATRPVAHVLRLLNGLLRRGGQGVPGHGHLAKTARQELRSRILISRVYTAYDVLRIVVDQLEGRSDGGGGGDAGGPDYPASNTQILVITEMDYHFGWMRLQGRGGRFHELYGQLMRQLRALAAAPLAATGTGRHGRLVLVLNGTMTVANRLPVPAAVTPETASEAAERDAVRNPGILDSADDDDEADEADSNMRCQLATSVLQTHAAAAPAGYAPPPGVLCLCTREVALAQRIEPRYLDLIDHLSSLHVCLTRLPPGLIAAPASLSSAWFATVMSDEYDVCYAHNNRFGVVRLDEGGLSDVWPE